MELQRQLSAGGGEQPLAGADHQREDEQVQLVQQPLAQQRADQGPAPGHADVLAGLLLEPGDLGEGAGRRDQGRVLPVRGRQGAGDYVSTTPSSEMNRPATIFLMVVSSYRSVWVGRLCSPARC
jgi:hypothetical protein